MQFRILGKEKVSALGFGCMRFPVIGGKIDEPQATRMIHRAIDLGVNYFDTAWGYHDGESEPFVGRALQKGWREKVFLATKLPPWLVRAHSDCDKYLNDQLKRLKTDRIDFYLMHALGKSSWEKLLKLDVISFIDKALKDGRIRYVGFSFHDEGENFNSIVDSYKWTFCQIQYNFMDEEYQAGTAGYKYALSKGLHVIGMEPLRGGKFTKNIPQVIIKLIENSGINRTPAEIGLRWVWNHEGISLVLSGMSSMEQVEENCRIADSALPGCLSKKEQKLIEKIKAVYLERKEIPCTNCKYCQPCPSGVDIPEILRIYNDLCMYCDERSAKLNYNMFMKAENRADMCDECGECESKCPQGIEIIELLKIAHAKLADR